MHLLWSTRCVRFENDRLHGNLKVPGCQLVCFVRKGKRKNIQGSACRADTNLTGIFHGSKHLFPVPPSKAHANSTIIILTIRGKLLLLVCEKHITSVSSLPANAVLVFWLQKTYIIPSPITSRREIWERAWFPSPSPVEKTETQMHRPQEWIKWHREILAKEHRQICVKTPSNVTTFVEIGDVIL